LIPPPRFSYEGYANTRQPNFIELSTLIRDNGPSTIVFIGYGSTAIPFFDALRAAYSSVGADDRPVVVLTDGCLVPELNTSGFEVYLTFPHSSLREPVTAEDRKDFEVISTVLSQDSLLSYEILGYDAMLILGQAVQECLQSGVDRDCIRSTLASGREFIGMAGAYKFERGENALSSYEILVGSPKKSIIDRQTTILEIDAGTLASIRSAEGQR
jgi:ABC-type branched-subunit amino acid transport system substrate-binding protein